MFKEKELNIQKVAKCSHRISISFPGMPLGDVKVSKSTIDEVNETCA
jgi:hypothetical protein